MRQSYITIARQVEVEYVEKKSRFIAAAKCVNNIDAAEEFLAAIKAHYRDASHHVYAMIIGEQDQIQRSNDDGEPSGTGGRPTLNTIQQADLHDTLIVVTRYFGGTLLGAGGLTRAYAKAANMAITAAGRIEKIPAHRFSIAFPYVAVDRIFKYIEDSGFQILDKYFSERVGLNCLIPDQDQESALAGLKVVSGGRIHILDLGVEQYIERLLDE